MVLICNQHILAHAPVWDIDYTDKHMLNLFACKQVDTIHNNIVTSMLVC